MALDEALLEGCGGASFVLRFYTWSAPAITLGRFQNAARCLDLDRCREAGAAVVRRPTGGRAVFHGSDLTYALVFPESALPDASVRGSYRLISAALARGLQTVGLLAREGQRPAPGRDSHPDCFAAAAVSDLVANGRKIAGGAQIRRQGRVLQQGSIRLTRSMDIQGLFREIGPRPAPVGAAFGELPDAAAPQPRYHQEDPAAANLEEMAHALALELARAFACDWEPVNLPEEAAARAGELDRTKYSRDEWNFEGKEL